MFDHYLVVFNESATFLLLDSTTAVLYDPKFKIILLCLKLGIDAVRW